jgi:uncharacterized cysteine cluster protein YcgN (CxxCxxCC family)
MDDVRPFHERKSLAEMTAEEWESLCDGCGKCCVVSLIDEDDPEERVARTCIGCRLLDLQTVRCSDYANRHRRVPDCVKLTPQNVAGLHWMPSTCAYRLIAQGRRLPRWHPLVTGDPESTAKAGMGMHGTLVAEADVDEADYGDYVVEE